VTWINKIDTSSFKVFHAKQQISKEFFPIIRIKNRNDITNYKGKFRIGCVGHGKSRRLNWLSKDHNNHWILSVSYGGRAYDTIYYFFDYDKGKINYNGLRFSGERIRELTFCEIVDRIESKKYSRAEIYIGE